MNIDSMKRNNLETNLKRSTIIPTQKASITKSGITVSSISEINSSSLELAGLSASRYLLALRLRNMKINLLTINLDKYLSRLIRELCFRFSIATL